MTNYNHFEGKPLTNHNNSCFFKVDIKNQKKAGMLATEVRSGEAPKPTFSFKTYETLKKNEQHRSWDDFGTTISGI